MMLLRLGRGGIMFSFGPPQLFRFAHPWILKYTAIHKHEFLRRKSALTLISSFQLLCTKTSPRAPPRPKKIQKYEL